MTGTGKLTTKAIAIIIIVAMLGAVGLPPVIVVFVTGVIFIVWLFARRAEALEVERIFDFYLAADAMLREAERRWYGFEIAEVIEQGESLLDIMPDPPPLNHFALGALYHRLGNHHAAVEYLSRLNEEHDEAHRIAPSVQLRRYVTMLRRLEQQPSAAPHVLDAIRSLERARQRGADKILVESRTLLAADKSGTAVKEAHEEMMFSPSQPLSTISAPPPISKVLRDVYQEETAASN